MTATDRHRPQRRRRHLGPRAARRREGRGRRRRAPRRGRPGRRLGRRATRNRRASSTPAGSPPSCTSWRTIADLVGRASSYAEPSVRRRHHRPRARRAACSGSKSAPPRSTRRSCSSTSNGRRCRRSAPTELLADERLVFCRHHLAAARRYRPHLLTEPEELVMTEKAVTGRSAWSRLFSEQTSTITVEVDGTTVSLEEALSLSQLT